MLSILFQPHLTRYSETQKTLRRHWNIQGTRRAFGHLKGALPLASLTQSDTYDTQVLRALEQSRHFIWQTYDKRYLRDRYVLETTP